MKRRDIDKLSSKIEHWKENELEDIKNMFVQTMYRQMMGFKDKPWTKEEQTNDMMRLRWMIGDMRFELDQLLKATYK